jgi:hypothetical protein
MSHTPDDFVDMMDLLSKGRMPVLEHAEDMQRNGAD